MAIKRSGLILALVLLTGCANKVAPWEKGNLAKPHMALEPHPMETSLRRHIHVSKEASSGGYGLGGGGCGCN